MPGGPFALALVASALATGSVRPRPVGRDLPGILRARHRHLRSLGQAGKSGGDHALADLQAGRDHRPHVVLLRQRHPPHRDGAVVLDHVDERAAGAALDGGGRHHHHLAQRVDQHPHIDELAGPELEIGIGKFGLELHRAGGLIDLIVDHQHLAAVERRLAVGAERVDRQRAFGEALG